MKSSTLPAIALGLTVALLGGCKKNIDNNDAVKQGISTYLAKRADLLAMDVNVTSVAYHGDEATATVRFQAKGNSSPTAGMSMQYVLERKGNQWVVKGRAGGEAHSGVPQGAPGGSPAPGANGWFHRRDAFHAAGASLGRRAFRVLPPGHPAIGSTKKSSDGK